MALKQKWQISMAALLYRAREDELVTPKAYQSAIKYMSRAGWRKSEPGDLGPPERPRLLRSAARALVESGMTVDDLAGEAHIPVAIVRLYVQPHQDAPRRVSVEV